MHGREAEPLGRCPMCPDSDGSAMNRLEEGALGEPVLAGNDLILNPNGRRSQLIGLQLRRQMHCQDGSSGIDRMPWPNPFGWAHYKGAGRAGSSS